MINLLDYPEIIHILNGIINNGGTAEIKNESHRDEPNLVVVEIKRTVRTRREKK